MGYFKGCMRNLKLNDVYLTFDLPGVTVVDEISMIQGCHGDDVCKQG